MTNRNTDLSNSASDSERNSPMYDLKMTELIKDFDWSKTSLGPVNSWPACFQTSVMLMLSSPQAVWLGGGKDNIMLYNDNFRALMGEDSALRLSKPAAEVFNGIWDRLEKGIAKSVRNKVGSAEKSLLIFSNKDSFKREKYLSFFYNPIFDPSGEYLGVFCHVTDETEGVISQRQEFILKELSNRIIRVTSPLSLITQWGKALTVVPQEIPLSMVYFLETNTEFKLKAVTGAAPGSSIAPQRIRLKDISGSYWPFEEALNSRKPVLVENISDDMIVDTKGLWNDPPKQVLVAPIFVNDKVVAVVILGLNPYRPYDEFYRGFTEKIFNQISSGLAHQYLLQEKRKSLSNIFSDAPVAIAVVEGPDQIYTLANPVYQRLIGRTEEQLLGQSIGEDFSVLSGQQVYEIFDKVYKSGETYKANEVKILIDRKEDGRIIPSYFNFVAQAMRDENGDMHAVMIHAVDVTEQVNAREKVIESEEKYRSLFRLINQGFCIMEIIFDPNNKPLDYKFIEFNPMFESQTGLKNAKGKTARQLLPNLEDHWFEIYGNVALTGKPYRFVEGSEVMDKWFEGYAFRIGGENSNKVALLFSDITERRKLEFTLKESEEYYRFISNTTPVMLWVTDESNKCVFLNQTWENFTGQTFIEGKGLGWLDVVHPDDRERSYKTFFEASKKLEPFSLDYRVKRKDGTYIWAIDSGAPLISEDGEFKGYTGYVVEIDERKKVERELSKLTQEFSLSNEELAAANEEIKVGMEELSEKNRELFAINTDMDNFIYTASHDLKAPIANIEGLVKVLERNLGKADHSKETVEKVIRMIYQSVERFRKTIVDLTEITKMQKEHPGEMALVNLSDVIEDVKQDFNYQLAEANVLLEVAVDNCQILFSRKKLRSIIYNLISNAIKYRSPKRTPHIKISCKALPEHFLFSVEDNGLGFNDKSGEKVFSMFKRLHTHVEGTGIGLYIVKKMIDDGGGKIEVESEVDKGSTFKVYFKKPIRGEFSN